MLYLYTAVSSCGIWAARVGLGFFFRNPIVRVFHIIKLIFPPLCPKKKEDVYAVSVHVSLLSQHRMVDQHNMGILGCRFAAAPSHGKAILRVKTVQIGLKLWKPPHAVTERIFLHAWWRATSFKQNLTKTYCLCWLTAAMSGVSCHLGTLKQRRVKATPCRLRSNSEDAAWKLHSVALKVQIKVRKCFKTNTYGPRLSRRQTGMRLSLNLMQVRWKASLQSKAEWIDLDKSDKSGDAKQERLAGSSFFSKLEGSK